MYKTDNKTVETNQKPASGFLIAHFKRYSNKDTSERMPGV